MEPEHCVLLYTILLLEVEAVLAEIENRVPFLRLHSQNANSNMVLSFAFVYLQFLKRVRLLLFLLRKLLIINNTHQVELSFIVLF